MDERGMTLGRYRIEREIDRGGMAVVYLARQLDLDGREVAVKQLGSFAARDPSAARRFIHEARITGTLNHPNIVTVHDYFERDGVPYIVMEYLRRGSLHRVMSGLSVPQVAGVLEGVLAALSHAGARGVVHRDLKPANVLLTDAGGVKVADFGIAKALASTEHLTLTDHVVGTPVYMAPEQARGGEITPRTDLYSVGVMAYEMLLGRPPFARREPLAILMAHAHEAPPDPRGVQAGIDPELALWLLRMLEKDPADRPADADAAWQDLEEAVVRLCGPLWRRSARLPVADESTRERALTPAPFDADARGGTARDPGATTPDPGATEVAPGSAATEAEHRVPTPATRARPRSGAGPAERHRRRAPGVLPVAAVAAVATVAAGAYGLALVVGGGGDGAGAVTTPPPAQAPAGATTGGAPAGAPPVATVADPRPAIAAGGGGLAVSDPAGAVRLLDAAGRPSAASVPFPDAPRAVLRTGGLTLVGGREGVARLDGDGRLRATVGVGGQVVALTRDAEGVVWAAVTRGAAGRVCALEGEAARCTDLALRPTGLAAPEMGRVVVADGEGALVDLRGAPGRQRTAGRLALAGPAGDVVATRAAAWVAVPDGVQRVDLGAWRADAPASLPASPSDLALTPDGVVAAVPAAGAVARIPQGAGAPALVATGGRPVAVATRDDRVLVVDTGRRAVLSLPAAGGGTPDVTARLPLGGRVAAAALRSSEAQAAGRTTTWRIAVAGGRIAGRDLSLPDADPADGVAVVMLRQAGIRSGLADRRAAGMRLTAGAAPGRVTLRFSSARGAHEAVRARVSEGGRAVLVTFTAPPPPPAPPPPVTDSAPPEPAPDTVRPPAPDPPSPPPPAPVRPRTSVG